MGRGKYRNEYGRKGLDILTPVRKVEKERKVLDYGVRSEKLGWRAIPC